MPPTLSGTVHLHSEVRNLRFIFKKTEGDRKLVLEETLKSMTFIFCLAFLMCVAQGLVEFSHLSKHRNSKACVIAGCIVMRGGAFLLL